MHIWFRSAHFWTLREKFNDSFTSLLLTARLLTPVLLLLMLSEQANDLAFCFRDILPPQIKTDQIKAGSSNEGQGHEHEQIMQAGEKTRWIKSWFCLLNMCLSFSVV